MDTVLKECDKQTDENFEILFQTDIEPDEDLSTACNHAGVKKIHPYIKWPDFVRTDSETERPNVIGVRLRKTMRTEDLKYFGSPADVFCLLALAKGQRHLLPEGAPVFALRQSVRVATCKGYPCIVLNGSETILDLEYCDDVWNKGVILAFIQ